MLASLLFVRLLVARDRQVGGDLVPHPEQASMPSFCDTGAIVEGDGCSDSCTVECGFACSGGTATSPDSCSTICGDGLLAVKNFS